MEALLLAFGAGVVFWTFYDAFETWLMARRKPRVIAVWDGRNPNSYGD